MAAMTATSRRPAGHPPARATATGSASVTGPPAREAFLSGRRGRGGGPLSHLEDRVLDARLAFARAGARLDELADSMPSRDALVLSIYRPERDALGRALAELGLTRHSLRTALGAQYS